MQNKVTLVPLWNDILILYRKRIIGMFKKNGVSLIFDASPKVKRKCLQALKEQNYITEELLKHLTNKLCSQNTKKLSSKSEASKKTCFIHIQDYHGKKLIWQNHYSRLLAIFQENQLDIIDEDYSSLELTKKIIEQLQHYQYIDDDDAKHFWERYET